MKYLLLILLVYSLSSCITLVPNRIENDKLLGVMPMQYGKVSYQQTVKVRADRENIFRQARKWTAFHMFDPSNALTVSDNMIGDVIAAGYIGTTRQKTKIGRITVPEVKYAVSIEALDNQYRVTLTSFFINNPEITHPIEFRVKDEPERHARQSLKAIDKHVNYTLEQIREFIEGEAFR